MSASVWVPGLYNSLPFRGIAWQGSNSSNSNLNESSAQCVLDALNITFHYIYTTVNLYQGRREETVHWFPKTKKKKNIAKESKTTLVGCEMWTCTYGQRKKAFPLLLLLSAACTTIVFVAESCETSNWREVEIQWVRQSCGFILCKQCVNFKQCLACFSFKTDASEASCNDFLQFTLYTFMLDGEKHWKEGA